MNKKYLSFGFAMLPLIAMLVGCSTKEDDSNILSILSDSEVYIYDFDNLESGISQREKEISTGTRENTYHNQWIKQIIGSRAAGPCGNGTGRECRRKYHERR